MYHFNSGNVQYANDSVESYLTLMYLTEHAYGKSLTYLTQVSARHALLRYTVSPRHASGPLRHWHSGSVNVQVTNGARNEVLLIRQTSPVSWIKSSSPATRLLILPVVSPSFQPLTT